jgi:hypothetical protein
MQIGLQAAEVFKNMETVTFDLCFSDEEILRAVKNRLKYLRSQSKESEGIIINSSDTLNDWHSLRLLALFDVLCWRKNIDKKLTYTNIGHIIWPNEEIEIEQRNRKKGFPLIKKVFSKSVARDVYLEHMKTVQKSG